MPKDPIDVHVGHRVRLGRTLLGMSQEKLGEALNLTFQQIQKYERGTNRISSSKLFKLSKTLGVPISFFFDGIESGKDNALSQSIAVDTTIHTREALEHLRALHTLPMTSRKAISNLVKTIANDMKISPT